MLMRGSGEGTENRRRRFSGLVGLPIIEDAPRAVQRRIHGAVVPRQLRGQLDFKNLEPGYQIVLKIPPARSAY